jgi:hypothetical protein
MFFKTYYGPKKCGLSCIKYHKKMNTKVEELLNQLDPNKFKCKICNEFFNTKEILDILHKKVATKYNLCYNCFYTKSFKIYGHLSI